MTTDRSDRSSRAHRGLYRDWEMTIRDEIEVNAYRAAVAMCASGASACAVCAKAHQWSGAQDAYFASALGLGAALMLIHMYVSEIRDAMRVMWVVGFASSIAIAANSGGDGVVAYVGEHRWTMWAIGPMFAALTGLAFKEGMCYGKAEAAALVFAVPALCLSHLFGAPDDVESVEAAAVCALLAIFAGRKFTQPVKDDIGDKSIFMFKALRTDEEREEWLRSARATGRDV